MGSKIALGTDKKETAVIVNPETIEEKLQVLQQQVERLTQLITERNAAPQPAFKLNRDSLPIGATLVGNSLRGGVHTLTVAIDGYYVAGVRYDSLSMAAEAVSGVRRSGWAFWRLPDGRSVKDAFGRE